MTNSVTTPISSLSELLNFKATLATGTTWFYRGQAADYPLIPSLGRKIGGAAFFDVERRLIAKFKEHWHLKYGVMPTNDWQWTAMAQHHGLPTRLLDWSRDSRVAAFFAVRNQSGEDCRSDGFIYVFSDKTLVSTRSGVSPHTTEDDVFRLQNVRPYDPQRDDFPLPRIAEQHGILTSQPKPTEDLWMQLSADAGHERHRLLIPARVKTDIRNQLAAEEITESKLFPDLDGMCRQVSLEVLGKM